MCDYTGFEANFTCCTDECTDLTARARLEYSANGHIYTLQYTCMCHAAGHAKQPFQFTVYTKHENNKRANWVFSAVKNNEMQEWMTAFKVHATDAREKGA